MSDDGCRNCGLYDGVCRECDTPKDWLDQAWGVWMARLGSAVEAGGVSLSESDCQNLLAVLLNERQKLAKTLALHT